MASVTFKGRRFDRLAAGIYRVNPIPYSAFGHIRKDGALWEAQIRDKTSGTMICCAGLWASLPDAWDEIMHVLRNYRSA